MARSELMRTLGKARELDAYVEALTDDERNYLRDLLDPEPEQAVKPVKKRKRAKGASKSSRATGIAAQLNKSLESQRQVVSNSAAECTYSVDGRTCHGAKDDAIHDKGMGYAGYHEFQPVATQAASGG